MLEVTEMSFRDSFANFTGHFDAAMDAVIGFGGSLAIFHNSAGAQCSEAVHRFTGPEQVPLLDAEPVYGSSYLPVEACVTALDWNGDGLYV